MTQLVPWILAHGLAALAIASAVGTLFGVLEKYLPGKWGNAAGTIAGVLIDVVKIGAQLYALLGGQPPSSPMGKRLTRGVFDDTTGSGPPIVLGKKPSADSFVMVQRRMRRLAFAFAFSLLLGLGANACKSLEVPTANEVACVAGLIASDPNAAPADYLAKCGIATLNLLAQVLEILGIQFAPAGHDAGAGQVAGPLDVQAIMSARVATLHNRVALLLADGGAQ